jgi:hypothetical protein
MMENVMAQIRFMASQEENYKPKYILISSFIFSMVPTPGADPESLDFPCHKRPRIRWEWPLHMCAGMEHC